MNSIPLNHYLVDPAGQSNVFSSADLEAARNTLKTLYPQSADSGSPAILPGTLLLLPNSSRLCLGEGQTPPRPDLESQSVNYALPLTQRATAAATSVACGSVLAGQTSESDDFGDIGFWLGPGPYGRGNEHEVLEALLLCKRRAAEEAPAEVRCMLLPGVPP